MASVTWGKPTLEIVALVAGEIPESPTWVELEIPVENSTQITTEAGTKKEAIGEGGEVVDVRYSKNKYSLEFELFAKDDDSKPIADVDGVVAAQYAIRLTPEDSALDGYIIEKAVVAVEDSWDADNGGKWKYTFTGLQPTTGNILKPYTAA